MSFKKFEDDYKEKEKMMRSLSEFPKFYENGENKSKLPEIKDK